MKKIGRTSFLATVATFACTTICTSNAAPGNNYVILVSCDGMKPDAIAQLGTKRAPNLHRLIAEGASTDNARTDKDITVTLPNHTCMISGRGVLGAAGHAWTENVYHGSGWTLHVNKGSYVNSMFDVAHDSGLRTGLFATKDKFKIFKVSYDGANGKVSGPGAKYGRNKIDVFFVREKDSPPVVEKVLEVLADDPPNLTMLHLHDADTAGHKFGFDSTPEYLAAVERVDGFIGQVLKFIEADKDLKGRMNVIVTADHGGGIAGPPLSTRGHAHAASRINFTIPFYVWGADAAVGTDLYALNRNRRKDPGKKNPPYGVPVPPIRNGDAGNLALDLLGLEAIPGSTINRRQDLRVRLPRER